jgi:hypothetical protein
MANPTALDPILASMMTPTASRTTATRSSPRKQSTQKTVPESTAAVGSYVIWGYPGYFG